MLESRSVCRLKDVAVVLGADLKKNLTAAKGCGPKVNGQKGRGQKLFAHAQCKVVKYWCCLHVKILCYSRKL